MTKPVAIKAAYKSHRTTADGGFALTFDIPEDCADDVNDIFKKKNELLILVVMTENEYMNANHKK